MNIEEESTVILGHYMKPTGRKALKNPINGVSLSRAHEIFIKENYTSF
jgi:hypothetical protein